MGFQLSSSQKKISSKEEAIERKHKWRKEFSALSSHNDPFCRGDPDKLCGSDGPGFCFVDCNADCNFFSISIFATRHQGAGLPKPVAFIKGFSWPMLAPNPSPPSIESLHLWTKDSLSKDIQIHPTAT